MSITIIQKSDLSKPRRNPKIAIVLAGGAISGGAFKLGGLIALDRFLTNRKVTEFDMYQGLSAGAFVGAFLAGGIPPEEQLKALNGTSTQFEQFKFYDFYWPAFKEYRKRAVRLGHDAITIGPVVLSAIFQHLSGSREDVRKSLENVLRHPGYKSLENVIGPMVSEVLSATPMPNLGRYIPSGFFDNSRIEKYVKRSLACANVPNDFRQLYRERGCALYITATNLNTARGTVFGHDAEHTVSISEAVQASTAIPGFYAPAQLQDEEYIDAMVRKTANTSLVVHKGANLIIVYNPFRPFMNRNRYQLNPRTRGLSDMGLPTVLNQTVRSMVHTRLNQSLDRLRMDRSFHGDVILIEPTETDAEFFSLNPLAFWNRDQAATQGFMSVRKDLEQSFGEVQRVLAAYGLECSMTGVGTELDLDPRTPTRENGATMQAASSGNYRKLTLVKG